ncbi:putative VP1 [Haiju virus]|nr:putative VP1 [Haiju virus]
MVIKRPHPISEDDLETLSEVIKILDPMIDYEKKIELMSKNASKEDLNRLKEMAIAFQRAKDEHIISGNSRAIIPEDHTFYTDGIDVGEEPPKVAQETHHSLPHKKTNETIGKEDTSKGVIAAAVGTPAVAGTIGWINKAKGYSQLPTNEVELSEVISETPRATSSNTSGLRFRNVNYSRLPAETFEIEEAIEGTSATAAAGSTMTGSAIAAGAAAVGTAATVAGGAVAWLASSYDSKSKEDQSPRRGLVLPGTKYVGPGNDIHIDAPQHEADAVAKEHDVAYQLLIDEGKTGKLTEEQFKQKLFKIDKEAIDKFAQDKSWQSFVGNYGLKFKTYLEQTINKAIYPPCKYIYLCNFQYN